MKYPILKLLSYLPTFFIITTFLETGSYLLRQPIRNSLTSCGNPQAEKWFRIRLQTGQAVSLAELHLPVYHLHLCSVSGLLLNISSVWWLRWNINLKYCWCTNIKCPLWSLLINNTTHSQHELRKTLKRKWQSAAVKNNSRKEKMGWRWSKPCQ